MPDDTLVVASGATDADFGHDEPAEFPPGMKTLEDGRDLRSDILSAFEMAELATDPEERAAYLTFVVVGAGSTGVQRSASWPSWPTRRCRGSTGPWSPRRRGSAGRGGPGRAGRV